MSLLILRNRYDPPAPVYWNGFQYTHPAVQEMHNVASPLEYIDFFSQNSRLLSDADAYRMSSVALGLQLFDDAYWQRISNVYASTKKEVRAHTHVLRSTSYGEETDEALLMSAQKIQDLWCAFSFVNVPPWFWGAEHFSALLYEQFGVSAEDFLVLATPLEQTATRRLDRERLAAARAVFLGERDLAQAARELSDRYGWIPFGYNGPTHWDTSYFINQIEADMEYGKDTLLARISEVDAADANATSVFSRTVAALHLDERTCRLFRRLQALGIWTDERKEYQCPLHYEYHRMLVELGKRVNVSPSDLCHVFTEELPFTYTDIQKIQALIAERKSNGCMLAFSKGTYRVLSSQERRNVLATLDQVQEKQEVFGVVASKGQHRTYRGTAKVVHGAKEGHKIADGDMLVAGMTTPDYIECMKRARGFITDEGGVTCHAAIIAREMDKPCIIATREATSVFRDGDEIELDMTSGLVRKIS